MAAKKNSKTAHEKETAKHRELFDAMCEVERNQESDEAWAARARDDEEYED